MKIFGLNITKAKERAVNGSLVTKAGSTGDIVGNYVEATNAYQATRIAAVFRCIDLLSAGVAVLPFKKKRLNRAMGYYVDVAAPQDSTNYLIGVRPNSRTTAFELLRNTVAQMVLHGNAYIVPRYGEAGQLAELILCSPYSVAHDTLSDIYTVTDPINGVFGTFTADQMIHIRNMSLDGGHTGLSTIQYAANALGIQATADKETKRMFATGGRIKGIVHNDTSIRGFGEYQDAQLDELAKQLTERVKTDDIVCLPGQAQFTPWAMTSVDMQLLEHKKFGVTEICRFFGVHPDKVFAQQSNNYKASEMSQVSFLTDTLNPILRKIENEFHAKLVPQAFADDYKFEFDTSTIYTTDLTTEAAYMEKTINTGVMTINEWRRKKGLQPVDGGDHTLVSCNVAPIGSAKIQGEPTQQNVNNEP